MKLQHLIFIVILWQFLSIYLMATGVWPGWVAWVNFGLIILFILFAPVFEGLLLVVASIPFYVILPQHYSDTLSMWRPVVGVLFLKSLISVIPEFSPWRKYPESTQRKNMDSGSEAGMTKGTRLLRFAHNFVRELLTYEKIAIVLFLLGIASLALAQYPLRGASQLVFLLNTALLYPVVMWTVKKRDQIIRLLKFGALSTGIIIAIGYIQFIATFFAVTYYFWQYWALRVANLFYGTSLAQVLQYSNSWVTLNGEEKTLRMFSIMPSSHAFAMVCVFFLAFALPLVLNSETINRGREKWFHGNWKLIGTVVFSCLALILSGTRGVWAGMVPALVVAAVLYYRKRWNLRTLVGPMYAALLVVVILFTASPLLDRGLGWIRSAGQSTLDRLISITNSEETSNAGRLAMWKAAGMYALHHPFGVGYGNFVVTLNPEPNNVSFEEAARRENEQYNLPNQYVTAHNLYLQIVVELSMVGLILFGIFWFFYYQQAWQYIKARATDSNAETIYIATISIVFLWFLAYSVFDLTWLNDKILLYTFLALGLARTVLVMNKSNRTDMSYRTDK